jgi:hypothetical protein
VDEQLYEISAPSRIRLHQQVGRAVEDDMRGGWRSARPNWRSITRFSSDSSGLSKTVDYAVQVARAARCISG